MKPFLRNPVRSVRRTREDIRINVRFKVWAKERPRLLGELVAVVRSDMTAPNDRKTPRLELLGESGGLRVVDDRGVLTKHGGGEHLCVLARYLVEVLMLSGTKCAGVALPAVQSVMNPLRDSEELRITFHH